MNYQYRFSVVMAVYQVEDYIREAIDSVIHQTIGFKHVQLILVDDGSTDKSGTICDEYRELYPKQIIVVHKENGGVSSAKNAGIKLAQGKYVSFLDPDDYLDKKTFKCVENFMDSEGKNADICCIPMVFFGASNGQHGLNNKFEAGTRVINLLEKENATFFQMSNASAFYRLEVVKKMSFDERLDTAEDAKENCRILIENPRLGVLADAKYHYRKRENSALAKSEQNLKWYIPHIKYFDKWVLDCTQNKYKEIPVFIQNIIMYDLQWKLNQEKIPKGVLTAEEENNYRKLVYECINLIDDNVILMQKELSYERKKYVLNRKHSITTDSEKAEETKRTIIKADLEDQLLDESILSVVLELFATDTKKNMYSIEGYFRMHHSQEITNYEPVMIIDGETIQVDRINRSSADEYCISERITKSIGFRGSISVQEKDIHIRFALRKGTCLITSETIEAGQLFPVTTTYQNAYAIIDHEMIRFINNGIEIKKKPSIMGRLISEIKWINEIRKKNLKNSKKAIICRSYYHLIKPFKRRKLWIVSDRIMKADDNGEALFRYMMQHRPSKTRILFAINKHSSDYPRIRKLGKCVSAPSTRYSLLYLLCDTVISSSADQISIHPAGYNDAIRDLVTRPKYVFLQHGITKDDISSWLNRYNIRIDGFVTSSELEKESIINGRDSFSAESIWLTGMPRFDRLYHDEKKRITIMPTWRMYLFEWSNKNGGQWIARPDFNKSEYYLFYHHLLNSRRLLQSAKQFGYIIQFFPHPNVQFGGIRFYPNDNVEVIPVSASYRDIYANSNLVITDYSSAVFDFAYLKKPVLYCQFDRDSFFAGEHVYTKGYFDYEQHGFGEVEYTLDAIIDRIIEYMGNDCKLKQKYRERIDQFFAYNDTNCCQRVLEKVRLLNE